MNYDWSKVSKLLRTTLLNSLRVDPAVEPDFRASLFETDQFHPFESDGDLSRALAQPDSANTDDLILDAVHECLHEMARLVDAYYNDTWNFPPGYKRPKTAAAWKDGKEPEDVCEAVLEEIKKSCIRS